MGSENRIVMVLKHGPSAPAEVGRLYRTGVIAGLDFVHTYSEKVAIQAVETRFATLVAVELTVPRWKDIYKALAIGTNRFLGFSKLPDVISAAEEQNFTNLFYGDLENQQAFITNVLQRITTLRK